jgi:hypothetical protein
MADLLREHDSAVLTAPIPAASDVERMAVERRVVAEFAPYGRAARAYEALWAQLRLRL